jgi:hypothetical protein
MYVTCIPIARQRLGKHIHVGANARQNRSLLVGNESITRLLNNRGCVFRGVHVKWL